MKGNYFALENSSYDLLLLWQNILLIDPSIVVFDKIPVIHTVRQLTKKIVC